MPNGRQVPSTSARVQVVTAALVFANFVYLVVAMVLRTNGVIPEEGVCDLLPQARHVITITLALFGIGDIVAAFVLKRVMAQRAVADPDGIARRRTTAIISSALCESAGFFGLVLAIMMGIHTASWILWALSLGSGILIFPTRAWLEGENP